MNDGNAITVRRLSANELLIEWRDDHGQIVGTFHPDYIGVALAETIESRDAEIERLREALQPFALIAAWIPPAERDEFCWHHDHLVGDYRQAARAAGGGDDSTR